jgi:bacteriorhodopsin
MNEPWFPEMYAWLPGTLIGVLGGLWGASVGMLAPRGLAKPLVTGFYWVLLSASVVMLIAGIAALVSGQPYGVWYGLGLAGMIGVIVLGANGFTMYAVYRRAEQRKMQARDM